MKTKVFHSGEYCLHGSIRVTLNDLNLKVQVMNYKTEDVQETASFHFVDKYLIQDYIENFTTPYYADKIINHFYA